jgi:hypothetical protein
MALLIRRVEMDERFKIDTKQNGFNKVNILGPEGQPLIVALDADSRDFRQAERALERMGLRSEEQPPAPQVRQRVTTTPAKDPYPNITIYEKAKKVWKGATDYAKAKGVPVGIYDGVEFFLIDDKPLKYFIGKHYPKIQHYSGPGGTQEIYDFLRSTGNYARERQDDDTSAIIVRCEFAESGGPVQWRSPRSAVSDWQREQARKEAKVTAKEAGEDREPAPVVVTTVEERRKAKEDEDKRIAEEAALNLIANAVIEEQASGVTEPAPTPSTVATLEQIGEVNEAFTMLREALTRALDGADHVACERETEFHKADAQVQRERAERAETTLHLIWTAFNEYPQHKAVAEILPLLPPMRD